jgi:predicted ATPase
MLKLDTLSIHGFKSIQSVDQLKLGQINIIIGANGAGKSNCLGVFSFLHAIRKGRLGEYVIKAGGADKVLNLSLESKPNRSSPKADLRQHKTDE